MNRLLEVNHLKTQFRTELGLVKAVDDVSYYVDELETVGVVGESGCGKSVTQLSVMQLVSSPGKVVGGEVLFENQNLLLYAPNGPEMRSVRGAKIAMIFQEPQTSLNPVFSIGNQMTEMLELHLGLKGRAARKRAAELLALTGIPGAEERLDDYPHQFSGGMRQRVMIAMAISCNPRILIADEPTTALDVTTQAQLLELMTATVQEFKSSLVVVTHNLGIVARYAKRIYIMYAGKIVESGSCKSIFRHPLHPYTLGLLSSVPRLDRAHGQPLVPIPGMPPNLVNLPPSCPFLPRCSFATEECREQSCPELRLVGDSHYTRCFLDLEQGAQ